MARSKKSSRWIKPQANTEPGCGCVYSVMGYLLAVCPKHEMTSTKVGNHD
jgi:hypothetical protein